ncbi:3-deoxy-7-phosphoheptulonate synthase [Endogone sp. FLAS-F59071]|nr:3-deoxy-7-phosphoheptulonate synthase [Endogone sp. FLAS-F59071]|eukprot:RUS19922.1 3-deoxy-7-phosphoheptulonate synthase [Endogone sp. FLAS-F59071]
MENPRLLFKDALNELDDKRIKEIKPLIPPQILMEDIPLTLRAAQTIILGRKATDDIIRGYDDRLLVIVGPCSIHDVNAAIEYAKLLRDYAETAKDDLCIIMRVYFEKPRTTIGWKGLINDPLLNHSFQINKGLRVARTLLLDLNELGVPTGCEFLDTISPQYTGDLVSWGAIGARTTESQVHRELASGLSCAVGFKNGTDGNINIAIDAIKAASVGHHFLSVTKQGLSAIVSTEGNEVCHVILRGSTHGPNFDTEHVKSVTQQLEKAKLLPRIMIDCSHGNSSKDHRRQAIVAEDIAKQLGTRETGDYIMGVMIESHLKEGRQDIPLDGPQKLVHGQSVTDACISWETTVQVLDRLREGVRARRTRA